jgi:hypothetical protein
MVSDWQAICNVPVIHRFKPMVVAMACTRQALSNQRASQTKCPPNSSWLPSEVEDLPTSHPLDKIRRQQPLGNFEDHPGFRSGRG